MEEKIYHTHEKKNEFSDDDDDDDLFYDPHTVKKKHGCREIYIPQKVFSFHGEREDFCVHFLTERFSRQHRTMFCILRLLF